MLLKNPYTKKCIDYPLDLSSGNAVYQCHIEHETFFCPWFTKWLVVYLYSGDILYIPAGERNLRDIYVVSHFYRVKEIKYPHGVYTLSYDEFLKESELEIPAII